MLFRKIFPKDLFASFSSLLKARLTPQLLFSLEGAMYPSEVCMAASANRVELLLPDIIGKVPITSREVLIENWRIINVVDRFQDPEVCIFS